MKGCSALLKHEVAYVLAQMEELSEHSASYLLISALNDEEHDIVRHEALISIGNMINDKDQIAHILKHPAPIVRESCEVAVRLIEQKQAETEYWKNKATWE